MTDLKAETRIDHADAVALMRHFSEEHGEFLVETGRDDAWEFRTPFGSMFADREGRGLRIQVAAVDETFLSYLKMGVADHATHLLGPEISLEWRGDGPTAGLPVFFREITVLSSRRLTPHMQRLRFSGEDLGRFATGGLHVRLLLPPAGRAPVWPVIGPNGSLQWPSGADTLTVRIYTIRAVDAERGWVEIDFVLHGDDDSPAATFARTAKGGEVIGMLGPGGEEAPDVSSFVLLGDETAIPAIGRMLEAMAPASEADVFIEVDGPADEQPLPTRARAHLHWLHRNGAQPGTAGLLSKALADVDWASRDPDTFVWAGCEHADARILRKFLKTELKKPRAQYLAAAYWRRHTQGAEGLADDLG